MEMGQNSQKWSRRSRWTNRTEIEDSNQNMSELVQNELTDQKLQQEILKEFVMTLLMDQKLEQGEHERIRDKLADGSTVETR